MDAAGDGVSRKEETAVESSVRSSSPGRKRVAKIAFVAGVVFAVGGGVGAALATPPQGTISRTEVASGRVTDAISIQTHAPMDFHIQQVTIDPGAISGWHAHPGPEYTIVKSGSVTLIKGTNCEARTVNAGEGFFVSGGVNHYARNDSAAPVELWVTYTLVPGNPARFDQANPCEGK